MAQKQTETKKGSTYMINDLGCIHASQRTDAVDQQLRKMRTAHAAGDYDRVKRLYNHILTEIKVRY